MDEEAMLMSDEELEGDVGSDFDDDGECFPSEWTVVDDADDGEFVDTSVTEDNSESTKKNDHSLTKPPDKMSDASSRDTQHYSRSQSQDKKTADCRFGDKKSDSTLENKKLDSLKKTEPITSNNKHSKSPSQSISKPTDSITDVKVPKKKELTEKKTSQSTVHSEITEINTSKVENKHDPKTVENEKSNKAPEQVKAEPKTTPVTGNTEPTKNETEEKKHQNYFPVATKDKFVEPVKEKNNEEHKQRDVLVATKDKAVIVKTEPKQNIAEEIQTSKNIAPPEHPLPKQSGKLNEQFYLFNAVTQSASK